MASRYPPSLGDEAQLSNSQNDSRGTNPASPAPLANKPDVQDKEVDPAAQAGQERLRVGQGPRSVTQLVSGQGRTRSRPTSARRTVESNKGTRSGFYGTASGKCFMDGSLAESGRLAGYGCGRAPDMPYGHICQFL